MLTLRWWNRLMVALAMIACAGGALAAEPRWEMIDENRETSAFYYDVASVAKGAPGMVTVWARAIYTEQGKEDALELVGNNPAFADLSHTHFLYTINCPKEQSRLEQVIHYDSKAEQIRAYNLSGKTAWEEIEPDTRMDLLRTAVCK